ncbi:MAG: ATP-binding protein [Patescibacteria group bacterium]|nr:ATP-binding protein [Patescibacteria group bacterium]
MLFDDFRVTILAISAVALLGLAILIVLMNRKHYANRLFGIWLMLVAAWSLSLAFFFTAGSAPMAELWMKAAYSSALICITIFFYFSLWFINQYAFSRSVLIADGMALLLFSIVIMVTDFVVIDMVSTPDGYQTILCPVGWYIFAISLLVHFLAAHLVLLMKFLSAKGIERLQLKYVLISVFIGGEIFGVLFNLILPSPVLNSWTYIWLGPTASAAIIAPSIAYAILRSKLFNTKGFIAEIIVFYTIFFIVVDAMLADELMEFILRLVLATGVVILGAVLIFNIRAEGRQKRELQRLTKELADANKKLEDRDEMRSEFISIASHQLRTPVSVMKGYLSLMLDGTYGRVPAKIRGRLKQMYEMNERLVLLINNMLNMARIEKNRIDFGFREIQLDTIAAEVVTEMAYKVEQKGLELKLKPHKAKIPVIVSDEEKYREILINLIDNAVKYTQIGSIEISFSVDNKKRRVTVYVSDTGSGMTKEDAAMVFDKFFRARTPNVPKESGTGLGLFIVTRFLKGMGGKIWIDRTEVGKGTTFAFCIPFKPPAKSLRDSKK